LLNLLSGQRKGGKQLREYLDNHLSHSDCRRDLGIDVEVIQKAFEGLEQIDQCVAVGDALDPLIGLDVTMMRV
jgi:hypothetical protein